MDKVILLILIIVLIAVPPVQAERLVAPLQLHIGCPYALFNGARFMVDANPDVVPFLSGDRVMVPARFVAEKMGFEITHNAGTGEVVIASDPSITLYPGEKLMLMGSVRTDIDAAPVIQHGRTFVPIGIIARALDRNVQWDDGLVTIDDKPSSYDKDEVLARLGVGAFDAELNDILKIRVGLKSRMEDNDINPTQPVSAWRKDGSFQGIDYSSSDASKWPAIEHLDNVLEMVKAAYSSGNPRFGDADYREKIALSLEYWVNSEYVPSDNWWYAEIAIPQFLADILLFEPVGLTPLVRASLQREAEKGSILNEATPAGITERPVKSTGANLTDKLITTFKLAVAANNQAEIYAAVGLLENEMRVFPQQWRGSFREDIEGIKPDYGFHQHSAQLQLGGYGEVFMAGVNAILREIEGTKYMVGDRALNEYANFILDGMQWSFRNDFKDFTVVGRGFSRPDNISDIQDKLLASVDLLLSMPRLARYDDLMKMKQSRLSGEGDLFAGNRHFWFSDYMAHKREGFHIGLKLASNRTKLGEMINGENLLGYYMSDGVTSVMLRGDEYENIFPIWDWNKLPGTTTPQGALKSLRDNDEWLGRSLWDWNGERGFVGGVSDGMYGAAVMDYSRDGLNARKAWFMYDDEMVALGNKISSDNNMEIYTSVNQCLLNGEVVRGDGFILHDGVGYVPGAGTAFELTAEERTGAWGLINDSYVHVAESKRVLQLGISHGVNPADASYAYTLVMNANAEQLPRYVKNPPVSVLRNDNAVQAVYSHDSKILQAVVWEDGAAIEIPGGATVAVDKKCLLIVRTTQDGRMSVAASNPENEPLDVTVTVNGEAFVIWLEDGPNAGKSVGMHMR